VDALVRFLYKSRICPVRDHTGLNQFGDWSQLPPELLLCIDLWRTSAPAKPVQRSSLSFLELNGLQVLDFP
jgi:hypothetical protein